MQKYAKINFSHRKDLVDYGDLMEILFPGNRNQQHAAVCIFFEIKWAEGLVPNLSYLEKQYGISRRIMQRTRAKLAHLGLIEYISSLNKKYYWQSGWKLSTRFERSLKRLAEKCSFFRDTKTSAKEKDELVITFQDAKRQAP